MFIDPWIRRVVDADKLVAIPSLFEKPNYPATPLEPLQRERSLRENEKSGWRDSNPRLLAPPPKNHPFEGIIP
jgi:hypothetical protein